MTGPFDQERRNPANYKWGVFYFAPQDPRVWVPKRRGLGWTLNFAHPASRLWMLAIAGVAAIVAWIASMADRAN